MNDARRPDANPLGTADRAEETGDLATALVALRQHLEHHPEDAPTRVRVGRLLVARGDAAGARRTLEPLEDHESLVVPVAELLAQLDEAEGRGHAAATRWERILAYEIDHGRARAHLAALRPSQREAAPGPPVGDGWAATFVTPEGAQAMRYRLLRELGRGASSAVYLARDESLGIFVALKVLHPHLSGATRSQARRRFFAEARMAAALRHPGVVAIYDLDEPTRSLAMEYVVGGTLRARLQAVQVDRGALSLVEVLETARSLLEALAYVHERGIVHGDLKPSNLLLRRPGQVVLADFGIAHLAASEVRSSDGPAGTPLYLAPEQLKGAPSSPFTDLFAAGAILWEIAAGRPMRQQADLVANRTTIPALPNDAVAHDTLIDLIFRLTNPAPERRLASAASALRSL